MFNNNTSSSVQAAKQEGDDSNHEAAAAAKYTTSTSRQWAGFKNPRIVRVSKAFGGKDRHSKVCTVKGLRDRRIRLSVPTAIQLYDLQDRLGLNQPSKVIDWLIDSTKDDIDKLPPLGQMLLPDFSTTQFHHPLIIPAATTTLNISQDLNSPQVSFSHQFLGSGSGTPPNITTFVKDVGNRTLLYTKRDNDHDDGDHERKKGKEALVVENEEENGDGNGGLNFFPIPTTQYSNSNYPAAGLMFPYINPYYNWEPPSNLSQFGNQGHLAAAVSSHDSSSSSSSSMAAISASQFLLYPPPPPAAAAAITPNNSLFTPYQLIPNLGENHDHPIIRQNNQFHLLSSQPANSLMPLFNLQSHDPQDKPPFGFDAQPKAS